MNQMIVNSSVKSHPNFPQTTGGSLHAVLERNGDVTLFATLLGGGVTSVATIPKDKRAEFAHFLVEANLES
jgi:hypothetical protein